MDRCVSLSVGSTGTASWTADNDYVLSSVLWDGQGATSFAALTQDGSFDPNSVGSGVKTIAEFVLAFAGQVALQISQLDYPVVKGSAFFLNCLSGGVNALLIFNSAE